MSGLQNWTTKMSVPDTIYTQTCILKAKAHAILIQHAEKLKIYPDHK